MEANKKKIAKNTIWLAIRMCVMLMVSLYTSRITLQLLGATDYGIYNAVGGVIVMLSFLTSSLSQGVQRFANVYLAKNDLISVNKIFSTSFALIIALSFIIVLVGETIGLWFVNTKLVIPEERMWVAQYIYQFSIIGVLLSLYVVPFNGLVTAHEDFSVFAKISMVDAFFKLAIVFCLLYIDYDKLLLYSILLLLSHFYMPIAYTIYSRNKYKECYWKICYDKSYYIDLCTFSGWNLLGTSTNIISVTGVNLILNIFFGPIINASRGIANQISTQIDNLIHTIQSAMNPQLQQLYTSGNIASLNNLIIDNFKWNFMIYWFVGLPLLLRTSQVLSIWLVNVPDYCNVFVLLLVIRCLIKCFERPVNTCLFAVGRMKWPNIFSSSSLCVSVILTVVLFRLGGAPYWAFINDLFAVIAILVFGLYFCKKYAGLYLLDIIKEAILPICFVILLSSLPLLFLNKFFPSTVLGLILIVIVSCIINSILYYAIILDQKAKEFIKLKIRLK